MMTLRARALGMAHTTFRNASGLPDPDQWTTARDLALLARHLVQDFPAEYRYFSTPSSVFHGRTILNHDHLLQTYPGRRRDQDRLHRGVRLQPRHLGACAATCG